jgi:hypothetical protein
MRKHCKCSWLSWVLGLALTLAFLPATTWACAVCWAADDALARGMNMSVLFLMAMPFVIGGSVIGVLYIAHKQARGQRWLPAMHKRVAWLQKENAQ